MSGRDERQSGGSEPSRRRLRAQMGVAARAATAWWAKRPVDDAPARSDRRHVIARSPDDIDRAHEPDAAANVWRHANAERASVLVDADAYYRALEDALSKAKSQIWILGWDIDSRLRLRRDGDDTQTLGNLLNSIVSRRGGPECFVLSWDFAFIYALERELLTRLHLGWKAHRRLHFELDSNHPIGASHHQKIVVIDDAVAFCGGIDLCSARWDTPAHTIDDPRRVDPPNKPHAPFHDVQMAVSGQAAGALGMIARERWFRATGERVHAPRRVGAPSMGWPAGVVPDFTDVEVSIARTSPHDEERGPDAPPIREVERLHLDAIEKAERTIYIENQYFTSLAIARALGESLKREQGPEIVIVQPKVCSGWLEQSTMGVLRAQAVAVLLEADVHKRLRLLRPRLPGDNACLNIHGKVTIVDDALLRVGSANLSNRSMGLDTECDLAIEACGNDDTARRIAGVRERLLAEHLDATPEEVRAACAERGLIGGIESLQGRPRSLQALEMPAADPRLDAMLPATMIADPERPAAPDPLVMRVLPGETPKSRVQAGVKLALLGITLVVLALTWRFTPLRELLSPQNLRDIAAPFIDSPLGPLYAIAAFVAGGLLVLPLTVLILEAGIVFGPIEGMAIAFAGALASATVTYWLGRVLGSSLVRQLVGSDRLRAVRTLERGGVLAVAALRLIPVGPFTIVNVACGSARLPFLLYLGGTALGVAPGIVMFVMFSSGIVAAIDRPSPFFLISVAAGLCVLALGLVLLARFVKRHLATLRSVAAAEPAPEHSRP